MKYGTPFLLPFILCLPGESNFDEKSKKKCGYERILGLGKVFALGLLVGLKRPI